VDLRLQPEQLPDVRDPGPGGEDQGLALEPAVAGQHGVDVALAELEADQLHALADLDAGIAGEIRQPAHGLHRVGPAPAALVQHRLHGRLPVGPGPGQVLAALGGADHQLRLVAHPLVLSADRHQVLDLALRHRGQVADLPEAIGVGVLLEHLHRHPDDLGDRVGAVVVAHDPAGDPRRAAADPALVDQPDVGPPLREAPGRRQSVYPAAEY
jgi:hypothetical protein